jgi:hypothetical protein
LAASSRAILGTGLFPTSVAQFENGSGLFCAAELSRTIGGRSGVWLPPPKYRNKEACSQDHYLDAHLNPVPDRRGISMSNQFDQSRKLSLKYAIFLSTRPCQSLRLQSKHK